MGTHSSKEHGYTAMGARLYNSETGRFMSVDPLAEIFTEHSPYHYGYNNPVMFSDPSGLAPEKETKVMSTSPDLIGGSVEQGYWNEITVSVYMGEHHLDSPLGPGAKKIQDFSFLDWVDASGEGGLSSANMVNDFGSSAGRASNKKETTTTLVERPSATVKKSVEQEYYGPSYKIDNNYLSQLEKDGYNLYSEKEFNDFNQLLDNKIQSPTNDFISKYDLNLAREEFDYNGRMLIVEIKKLITFATKNNATFLIIASDKPLTYDENKQNLVENGSLRWHGDFRGQFFGQGTSVFIINYDINMSANVGGVFLHEMTHWQMLNKYGIKGGHPELLFDPYLNKLLQYHQKIND